MRRRRILLLGLGRTGHPYLRRARARDLAVTVVDRPSLLASEDTRSLLEAHDHVQPVPVASQEAYYAAGSRAVAATAVDGVLAVSELQVVPAALLAEEFAMRGPGLRAATVSRNKLLQRELFRRHGVAQPDFHLVHGPGEALRWARNRYPVVVKPLSGSGSANVCVVSDRAALTSCYTGPPGPSLIEEFCAGSEYSLEGVVKAGRLRFGSVTAKVTTAPPYCVELEHHVPAALPPAAADAVNAWADGVVRVAGVRDAVVHLEFRLGPAGPVVMELAVRAAGDHIPELVDAALGVDLYDAALSLALGEELDVAVTRAGAAVAWFPSVPPGRLREVRGLDEVRALPGVLDAPVLARPGDVVAPLRSSADRLGAVLVSGADPAAAGTTLAAVRRLLVLRTEGTSW